ncbi:MAG: hypothetical protein ACJ788_27630 [Ktedonobacteraceae bacterium]
MNQLARPANRLDSVALGLVLLTLITAGAHLYLAAQPDEDLRFWFLLNGVGYLVLLAAFELPQFAQIHKIVRWVLMGYALLTIILWFFLGSISKGELDPFDITVKVVEAALVLLLFLDSRRERVLDSRRERAYQR